MSKEETELIEYLIKVQDDLYEIYNRLADNYNGDVEFKQYEEDRLILFTILNFTLEVKESRKGKNEQN